MAIYVSGSLAFDRIMNFSGRFSDHILADKIHTLNVSFFVENLEEKRGGCAGNIAYNLALLGKKPIILASAGKDFDNYAGVLKGFGLSLAGIRRVDDKFTAAAYINTDTVNNQITAFCASAMLEPCRYDFKISDPNNSLAIISPGNMQDMSSLTKKYKQDQVRYVYDPGQQIPVVTKEELLEGIQGSLALVTNDYELEMIRKITERSKSEILEMTNCLITTYGERGSFVQARAEDKGGVHIAAVPVEKVLDPTGAGDAYRSGLIKGLDDGMSFSESAKIGATCASFCVEQYGTQEHTFTMDEFMARHNQVFA